MKSNKIWIMPLLILLYACGNGNENFISESGIAEFKSVSVTAQTPGELVKLYYNEGDMVSKGDTIAELDHEKLSIQLEQAEANLKGAIAQLNLLNNGARKEDIQTTKAQLDIAQSNLSLAEKNFNRINSLFEQSSASESQLDEAKLALDIAKANYNKAKSQYQKISNFARKEDIQRVEAQVDAAKANIELLKSKINDSYIVSPIDGIISELYYETGEVVPAYSVVCDLINSSSVEVEIFISETDLGKVKRGMEAKISSDSFPDEKITGHITNIAEEAEFTPKTIQTKDERTKLVYRITITADNKEQKLKGGMPVDVEIEL